MASNKLTLGETIIGGLAIGYVATQALDVVSTYLYHRENPEAFKKENEARGGRHAYENGPIAIAKAAGIELDENQKRKYGWAFHRTFGIASGVQYLLMRRVFPKIGFGWGLLFGAGFFVLVDEVMNTLTGMAPPPQKFPWQSHARGFVSHVAYGLAAETAARAFTTVAPPMRAASEYARRSSLYDGHAESFTAAP